MGATRLPGKVLADVNGRPVIERMFRRLRKANSLHDIVLATTTLERDDAVAEWASQYGVPCYRGSEDDVLRRVVEAQRTMNSDIVVELCGDTPLIDPGVVDTAVSVYLQGDCDVVTTTWKLSYPQGIDAQVFSLAALEEVERNVSDPAVREHVSLYFYENPERYKTVSLEAPSSLNLPDQRCQLDYPEDLAFICEVYSRLEPIWGDAFGVAEIVALLRENPELKLINADCEEKAVRNETK